VGKMANGTMVGNAMSNAKESSAQKHPGDQGQLEPNRSVLKDLMSVRSDFPILSQKVHRGKELVYLDSAASSQRPQAVLDAMEDCYKTAYSNVHRGVHTLSQKATDLFEQARGAVVDLLGAKSQKEIIFSSGTTAAINLVAGGLENRLQPGDRILLPISEHHSNIVPWQMLAQRRSLQIDWCSIDSAGELDLAELERLLTEKTKIVAFAAASNVLGCVNPVKQIVSMARRVGALTVVDAAQAVPHHKVDVQDWDCDFLAFSAHKMLGPSGIGVLYGKQRLLEEIPPVFGGGSMIGVVEKERFTYAELPAKFEAGTPPIVESVGLMAAIDYLQKIGLDKVDCHQRQLVHAAYQGIEDISGIKILGPAAGNRIGILSFSIDGLNSQDIAQFLDFQGIAVRAGHHCAMPLHDEFGIPNSVRASFYLYNTMDEVEFFCKKLREVIQKLR